MSVTRIPETADPRSPCLRRRGFRCKSRLERSACGFGHTQNRSHLRQLDCGRRYLRDDNQPLPDVFWQSSQEVEEIEQHANARRLKSGLDKRREKSGAFGLSFHLLPVPISLRSPS